MNQAFTRKETYLTLWAEVLAIVQAAMLSFDQRNLWIVAPLLPLTVLFVAFHGRAPKLGQLTVRVTGVCVVGAAAAAFNTQWWVAAGASLFTLVGSIYLLGHRSRTEENRS